MTKLLKALKILLFIGAGLFLGNYLILSVFTLFDAIQWIIGGFFFPITNIVYLLKTNHQYSLGLLFAVICILSAIVIIISEKQNKNGVGLSKEERQEKILKSVKIMLFIVGGLFLIYFFLRYFPDYYTRSFLGDRNQILHCGRFCLYNALYGFR